MSLLARIDWNPFLNSPAPPIMFMVAMVGVIIIVAIVALQIRKTAEVRLKERMVARGYSSDEILEVMGSGAHPSRMVREKPQRAFFRSSAC